MKQKKNCGIAVVIFFCVLVCMRISDHEIKFYTIQAWPFTFIIYKIKNGFGYEEGVEL